MNPLRIILIALLWISGCATATKAPIERKINPKEVLTQICSIGNDLASAQGTISIKTNSQEVTGQFAASVNAIAPDKLRLEVTNFLGGSEALITIEGNRYELRGSQKRPEQQEIGFGTWGGIPLHWAPHLFLGKFPCPSSVGSSGKPVDQVQAEWNAQGDLVVMLPEAHESFLYHLGDHDGVLWPESLKWEKTHAATPLSVEFKFDDPEKQTLCPKKWEAQSIKGLVKIRWKDRDVSKRATG